MAIKKKQPSGQPKSWRPSLRKRPSELKIPVLASAGLHIIEGHGLPVILRIRAVCARVVQDRNKEHFHQMDPDDREAAIDRVESQATKVDSRGFTRFQYGMEYLGRTTQFTSSPVTSAIDHYCERDRHGQPIDPTADKLKLMLSAMSKDDVDRWYPCAPHYAPSKAGEPAGNEIIGGPHIAYVFDHNGSSAPLIARRNQQRRQHVLGTTKTVLPQMERPEPRLKPRLTAAAEIFEQQLPVTRKPPYGPGIRRSRVARYHPH